MRGIALSTLDGVLPEKSLAARGGARRTFAGIAIFLVLWFLGFGVYLIQDEFANPVAAQSIGLFTAALILTTGVILLFYLIQPRKNRWRKTTRPAPGTSGDWITWTARSTTADWYEQRRDLPFQRWYVDPVRIRSRRVVRLEVSRESSALPGYGGGAVRGRPQ